jgi:hypothetical protein
MLTVYAFRASMQIDYMKWHDGVGYDIPLIHKANAKERKEIEALLLDRRAQGFVDWRDIEAFAALGNMDVLLAAAECGKHEIEVAVVDFASHRLSDSQKNEILLRALAHAEIGSGLAEALQAARKHPTPEVIAALRHAIAHRKPGLSVLFQETLDHICGRSVSSSSL